MSAESLAQSATGATRPPARRALLSPTLLLMVAFLASRLLGMLRQTFFTAVFGATAVSSAHGIQSDAFYTAFRAPDLLFNLISGGALTSAFLPTFAGYLARKTPDAETEAWRVASTVFYLTALVLTPLLLLAMLLAPFYVPLLVPNSGLAANHQLIEQTIPLTRIMLLQPLFLAMVSICQGVSNSYLRFTVPAFAPLIYNGSIIVGIAFGAHFGITAVAWAVTLGAALQFAVQIPWLPQRRRLFRLVFDVASPGVHEIVRLMGPRLFGQAGIQASFIATTTLANFLPSKPNPALSNGWALILLPIGIFAASRATTAFPAMARQAAASDQEGFARTVSETVSMVFFLTVPAAAGLILLAPRVVRVLFAWGNANNTLDVHLITLATVYYAVGIPGHALAEVLPRAFYAIRDTRTPVLVAIWTLALAIFLSTIAVRIIPGNDAVAGLALAVSIAVLAEAVNLALALRRKVPEFLIGPLGWSLVRANLAAGIMTAGMAVVANYLTHEINTSRFGSFVALCICVPLGAAIYLAAAVVLRAPEATQVLGRVRLRLGRRGLPRSR